MFKYSVSSHGFLVFALVIYFGKILIRIFDYVHNRDDSSISLSAEYHSTAINNIKILINPRIYMEISFNFIVTYICHSE